MGADTFLQTMEDRAHFHVNRLHAAESPFHHGESLVSGYGVFRADALGRHAGTHHIETIERRLGPDLFLFALILEIGIRDCQLEMLAYFVLVDDFSCTKGDVFLATQWISFPPCGCGYGLKHLLCGFQQFFSRAAPVFGQKIGLSTAEIASIVVVAMAGGIDVY